MRVRLRVYSVNATLIFQVFLISLFLSSTPGSVFAASNSFPGPRPTLIDLYANADLVISAKVTKTARNRIEQVARLKVISLVKNDGRKAKAEIEAFIRFGSHWPIPFEQDSQIITFLEFDEERKMYTPLDSRTGLDVSEERLARFYITQLKQLPKILLIKNRRAQLERKIQWYIDLILFPPARQHGGYGISALWSRSLQTKLLNEREQKGRANILTNKQKNAICHKLFKETPASNSAFIVEILREYPSAELDHYLVQSIKRSLMFEQAVPIAQNRIPILAYQFLPKRLHFMIPKDLLDAYEEFTTKRKHYIANYNNRSKKFYSQEDKEKAYDDLIRQWRDLAPILLSIPQVASAGRTPTRH